MMIFHLFNKLINKGCITSKTIMFIDNNHLSIEFVKIIGKELITSILDLPNFAIFYLKVITSYKCKKC